VLPRQFRPHAEEPHKSAIVMDRFAISLRLPRQLLERLAEELQGVG
jgi:hypothetical protein